MLGPRATTSRVSVDLSAQATTVSYDTFMKLDLNERLQTFSRLTPANQADLAREHLVRWRRANAPRLTSEQDQILTDTAEFIRTELYEKVMHSDDVRAAFLALEERAGKAFTPQEIFSFTSPSMFLPPR